MQPEAAAANQGKYEEAQQDGQQQLSPYRVEVRTLPLLHVADV